jgi:voltage-gated potassium channel Kch
MDEPTPEPRDPSRARAPLDETHDPATGRPGILVCGLGRLGQHCVATLKSFGVPLYAIDARPRDHWLLPDLPRLLDALVVGDFRLPGVLEQAHISACRAVLLLAPDERVNISAAFAARALRADVRVVMRSARQNLNELLATQLGNFAAFEPTQLSAPAFALSALGDETVGLAPLPGRLLRVKRRVIAPGDSWVGSRAGDLSTAHRRVLSRRSSEPGAPASAVVHRAAPAHDASAPLCGTGTRFHAWTPEAPVRAGEAITFVELADTGSAEVGQEPDVREGWLRERLRLAFGGGRWRRALARAWNEGTQMQRVALTCAGVLSALYVLGAVLYQAAYPDIGVRDALNVAMVLVLGGFDNLFGQLRLPFPIPGWLYCFSVLLSVAGTVAIGVLYAFLTERLLAMRLNVLWRRTALPRRRHVILSGGGRLAREVATLLQKLRCPIVRVGEGPAEPDDRTPFVAGPLSAAVERLHLDTARSFVALPEDEVESLEAALTARAASPRCALVLRADDPGFRDHVAKLVAGVVPISAYALAAEAFSAAAFGENVHGLVHLDDETLLVTEYEVEPADTLAGRLLAEVAYGYGVVPLLLEHARDAGAPSDSPDASAGRRLAAGAPDVFPSDDVRLAVGDRLFVLASFEALGCIERGEPGTRAFHVHIEEARWEGSALEAAMTIARVSGCEIAVAQKSMTELPTTLPVALYRPQAERLVRKLGHMRVRARVEPAEGSTSPAAQSD